ncbi:13648_t:CDS:2, partial [Gigaspora margarita]
FHDDDMEGLPRKLSHNNSWKEDEATLANIVKDILSAERQSLASADRRGRGKQPDIMFLEMCRKKIYELMYIECSHLICTDRKKKDDEVKLWREMNDWMCYVYRSCRPVRNEFGILGIQVAADMMHLNILIKDDDDIHRLFHLRSVKIPVRPCNEDDVLQFVEALSERLKKRSSSSNITVTTPEHPFMDEE